MPKSNSATPRGAWARREAGIRSLGLLLAILAAVIITVWNLPETGVRGSVLWEIFVITVLMLIFAGALSFFNYQATVVRERKIEVVEERQREHPEKPQLAWDLATVKLENYLDRNLSQVDSIYVLTLIVMISGFGFVIYGLVQASQNPAHLPVSIVAAASGVIISFIGGSFLLIYRSILAQSKDFVTVLERINAVGMAVQVIASIPDANAELKNQATAELAKQLLSLYATAPPRTIDEPSSS